MERGVVHQADERWRLTVGLDEVAVGVPENVARMIAREIDRLEEALGALGSIPLEAREVFYAPEIHRIEGELLLRRAPTPTDEAERHFHTAIDLARASEEVARAPCGDEPGTGLAAGEPARRRATAVGRRIRMVHGGFRHGGSP
jgi:hypothetical protein